MDSTTRVGISSIAEFDIFAKLPAPPTLPTRDT